MPLTIKPVTFNIQIKPKKYTNNTYSSNPLNYSDVSFGSLRVSNAIKAQALSSTKRSIITNSKTRLGANYNKELQDKSQLSLGAYASTKYKEIGLTGRIGF